MSQKPNWCSCVGIARLRGTSNHYCGWGEDCPLGLLADDGTTLLFEYSPEALAQRLELSP